MSLCLGVLEEEKALRVSVGWSSLPDAELKLVQSGVCVYVCGMPVWYVCAVCMCSVCVCDVCMCGMPVCAWCPCVICVWCMHV